MHKCDIGKYKLITNGDFEPQDADAFLLEITPGLLRTLVEA